MRFVCVCVRVESMCVCVRERVCVRVHAHCVGESAVFSGSHIEWGMSYLEPPHFAVNSLFQCGAGGRMPVLVDVKAKFGENRRKMSSNLKQFIQRTIWNRHLVYSWGSSETCALSSFPSSAAAISHSNYDTTSCIALWCWQFLCLLSLPCRQCPMLNAHSFSWELSDTMWRCRSLKSFFSFILNLKFSNTLDTVFIPLSKILILNRFSKYPAL